MRLIDADELMEHAGRDKLDSRELIMQMIKNAPTMSPVIKTKGDMLHPKEAPRFLNELACYFGTVLHDTDMMIKLTQCSSMILTLVYKSQEKVDSDA